MEAEEITFILFTKSLALTQPRARGISRTGEAGTGFDQCHQIIQILVLVKLRLFIQRQKPGAILVQQFGDMRLRFGRRTKSHNSLRRWPAGEKFGDLVVKSMLSRSNIAQAQFNDLGQPILHRPQPHCQIIR